MPDRFKNVTNRWQVAEHISLFTWFSLSGKCTRTPYFVQECVCQHFANLVRRIILYGICKMSNIFMQHFANFILKYKRLMVNFVSFVKLDRYISNSPWLSLIWSYICDTSVDTFISAAKNHNKIFKLKLFAGRSTIYAAQAENEGYL